VNAIARKTTPTGAKIALLKKSDPKALTETIKLAFAVREPSHRATILVRLARESRWWRRNWSQLGDRVQLIAPLPVLIAQGEKNKAPFAVTKTGEGETATFTLKRP
jgi:hypothetical protein